MRKRVEKTKCPVCRNSDILRKICTGCEGTGMAIVVFQPNGLPLEVYPTRMEAKIREQYPDMPTEVHDRTTLAQAWELFVDTVEIRHASTTQQREMKRSFFAGAHWILEVLGTQLDPVSTPTADDLEYMQRISAEIEQFNDDIQAGRA